MGFVGQVGALTKRQFHMRLQDKFQLVTSYSLSWVRAPVTCLIVVVDKPLVPAAVLNYAKLDSSSSSGFRSQ